MLTRRPEAAVDPGKSRWFVQVKSLILLQQAIQALVMQRPCTAKELALGLDLWDLLDMGSGTQWAKQA